MTCSDEMTDESSDILSSSIFSTGDGTMRPVPPVAFSSASVASLASTPKDPTADVG